MLYGVGYLGIGKWKTTIRGRQFTKEYNLWRSIIQRCYSPLTQASQPTYVDVTVDDSWLNYQTFCDDIITLENYHEWKNNKGWEIDKDIKANGVKKYCKETCMFVSKATNTFEMLSRTIEYKLTGETYIAISPDGKVYEFRNQSEFARLHSLNRSSVYKCISGVFRQHKGWTFKIKNEI